jgi:hypothetical protein
MAKDNQQKLTNSSTNTFVKGLNKDADAAFIQEGMWTHARNAVNNTIEGDLGTISNEASNALCIRVLNLAPVQPQAIKKIIGAIHLFADKWVIFSSVNDHINTTRSLYSEIGLFEENSCSYRVIVEQSTCLNFSMYHLITGAARLQADCSWGVYFADGNNPDRYINIGDPKNWLTTNYLGNNYYENNELWPGTQWQEKCNLNTNIDPDCFEPGQGCQDCFQLNKIDCNGIRLARIVKTPCTKLSIGNSGGSLSNGSYMALIAYSIKGQKVTDWFSPSSVQPLWFELEPFGSLELEVTADTANFDEFILCVVSVVNQNTVAKQFGIYSTRTQKITIDIINASLPSIPIEQLPIQTPVFEKSDQMVEVNNYLLRIAPTTKFDFNYQPLANLIATKWVSVEYDADYYVKHGYKPSYMRDEVYAFYIRWVYNTGDKTASYHIPGRYAETITNPCTNEQVKECSSTMFSATNHNVIESTGEKIFEVFNTGNITTSPNVTLEDGGLIVSEGKMGYWESTELYPGDKPEIWNSTEHCWTGTEDTNYNLCGKPIRHHKFPEQSAGETVHHFAKKSNVLKIRILGVKFENIILPKDNDGNDIEGIVGYEILRGSREGNRSVVAKGMINNMRPYNIIKSDTSENIKGLYPNYPFNTIAPINPATDSAAEGTLNDATNINDPYIINVKLTGGSGVFNPTKLKQQTLYRSDMPKNIITFHSPDTNFTNPFLGAKELKLYGYVKGLSQQKFIHPAEHPKHQVMTNGILIAMIAGGIVNAIIQSLGKKTINSPDPVPATLGGDITAGVVIPGTAAIMVPAQLTWESFLAGYKGLTALGDQLLGGAAYTLAENTYKGAIGAASLIGAYTYNSQKISYESGINGYLGFPLRAATGFSRFILSFSEGANNTLEIVKKILPFRQYALQMQAHGLYDQFITFNCQFRNRFIIDSSLYLKTNSNQRLRKDAAGNQYVVTNSLRQQTVVLNTKSLKSSIDGPEFIDTINGADADTSLITVGTSGMSEDIWSALQNGLSNAVVNKIISSHYGAIKVRLRNQYGQLDSIKQIPITPCEQKVIELDVADVSIECDGETIVQRVITSTDVYFGGDTYINRYTEKNNMFFFNNWLYKQPNGTIFNYFLNQTVPQARFWLNTEPYDTSSLLGGGEDGIVDALINFLLGNNTSLTGSGALPRNFYKLDNKNYDYTFSEVFNITNPSTYPGLIAVKESFFYLANSSIRDFFVESEVIVDYRQAKQLPYEKHYNPYGFNDLAELLNINPDWITRGNSYFYDYSLSIGKLFTQYFSQGNLQSRFYDPKVSSQCYTYYPDRILYSLPQQLESVKDSWFTYLANNYKSFQDSISGVKNFAKTGIFVTFHNASPLVLQGTDQLQTDLGTKITIGDGGLFANQPQNVVVADRPYEFGSSQNRLSIVSTPIGMFYVSQNQGKVFTFNQGLQEISNKGMKWWFNNFLPYKLLEDFPEYPHSDNPVAGIGIHASYNNDDAILYFSKRDFKLRENYVGLLEYDLETNTFFLNNVQSSPVILLGDSMFFEDASWTMSYDPKNQFWISYHDWHPNLFMPSRNKLFTSKENGIWEQAKSCTSYCNFYGVDYPFEVEVPVSTGQQVTTLRSMEYLLECYRRSEFNCVDQFHVLDTNFDQAVIYNTEQTSGILELVSYPKNNPFAAQQFPEFAVGPDRYRILFSKEENKYRFNQFWDITQDRGEFTNAQENIWITQANGYIKDLNPLNIDYQKATLERKRFRHYSNFLNLRKEVSGDTNMILKIFNTKTTYSPR